jgi:hypothetical protein
LRGDLCLRLADSVLRQLCGSLSSNGVAVGDGERVVAQQRAEPQAILRGAEDL